MAKKGVPFTLAWGKLIFTIEARQYCRFTEQGELQQLTVYEHEVNPPLAELKARLTKPLQLVEYIKQYERERTPLPWDNQAENAKRYLTRKLLKSEA
jgi:hypothetical protein